MSSEAEKLPAGETWNKGHRRLSSGEISDILDEAETKSKNETSLKSDHCPECVKLRSEIAQLKSQLASLQSKNANAAVEPIEEKEQSSKVVYRCLCGGELVITTPQACYNNFASCDWCEEPITPHQSLYHCTKDKISVHPHGFDLCIRCATRQEQSNPEEQEIYRKAVHWLPQPSATGDISDSRSHFVIELLERHSDTYSVNYFDKEDNRGTLLHIAAARGYANVAKYLLQRSEIDIEITNAYNRTALTVAIEKNQWHVAQLIYMKELNLEIRQKAEEYYSNRQSAFGMAAIFAEALKDSLGDDTDTLTQRYNEWMQTLEKSVINCIVKRRAISTDLLMVVWRWRSDECDSETGMKQSQLWKTIETELQKILSVSNVSTDPIGWIWFKRYLLSSPIWLEPSKIGTFYDELLTMVDNQLSLQKKQLSNEMQSLINKNKKVWLQITELERKTEEITRQDSIGTGALISIHNRKQLEMESIKAMSGEYDPVRMFDLQIYLSEIVARAHKMDNRFHESLQSLFADSIEQKTVTYQRGPVKTMERSATKAETDYSQCKWPTSSQIIDLNRASLTCYDLESYLTCIQSFMKAIADGNNSFTRIARLKNGFFGMQSAPNEYKDIKINVVCSDPQSGESIIGEVQFLLNPILQTKKKAHQLYEIVRIQKLFSGVTTLETIYGDMERQCNVALSRKDTVTLAQLCVTNSIEVAAILSQRPEIESPDNEYYNLVCGSDDLILKAIATGDLKLVKCLVDPFSHIINWRLKNEWGMTIIHFLFYKCKSEQSLPIFKYLLTKIPPIVIAELLNTPDKQIGETAILLALKSGSTQLLESIVDHCTPYIRWQSTSAAHGLTLWHMLCSNTHSNVDILKRFYAKMPTEITLQQLNAQNRTTGSTPVMKAISTLDYQSIIWLISTFGPSIDWNITSFSNETILHCLAKNHSTRLRGHSTEVLTTIRNVVPTKVLSSMFTIQDVNSKRTPLMEMFQNMGTPSEMVTGLFQQFPTEIEQTFKTIKDNTAMTAWDYSHHWWIHNFESQFASQSSGNQDWKQLLGKYGVKVQTSDEAKEDK